MRPAPILLDTCAAIWTAEAGPLSSSAEQQIEEAFSAGAAVLVSPITAWEVGQLVSRGRLALTRSPKAWFAALLSTGLQLAALEWEVLVASSSLPSCDLRDPADKILAATARAYGYRLMTRDAPLLNYAAAGHLHALAC